MNPLTIKNSKYPIDSDNSNNTVQSFFDMVKNALEKDNGGSGDNNENTYNRGEYIDNAKKRQISAGVYRRGNNDYGNHYGDNGSYRRENTDNFNYNVNNNYNAKNNSTGSYRQFPTSSYRRDNFTTFNGNANILGDNNENANYRQLSTGSYRRDNFTVYNGAKDEKSSAGHKTLQAHIHPFLRTGHDNDSTKVASSERVIVEDQGNDKNKLSSHMLRHQWTFWYLEKENAKSWEDMQNEVASFESVEEFWGIFYLFRPPSELKAGCDYSVFKKGIRPMWEDNANINGGRWVMTTHRGARTELDHLWMDTLLCIIGESTEEFDDVNGAVLNIRGKFNKISIWTADGSDFKKIMAIGMRIKQALNLTYMTLAYELHSQTAHKTGTNVKPAYVI